MRRNQSIGTVAVAATYVFFLIFAQFGFLRLLEAGVAAEGTVRNALAAMGVAGLLASLGTAAALRRLDSARLVRVGLLACGGAALVATVCSSAGAFIATAAWVGAATGLLTVALAADLRRFMGGTGYGLRVGLGTGTAYALCNVPALFTAPPEVQATVAAAGCLLTAILPGWQLAAAAEEIPSAARRLDRGWEATAVLAAFLVLVWLDSSAFSVIQRSPDLQALTWGGWRIWLQGASHFAGALAAGWWIDRGVLFGLLPGSFALFVLGLRLLAIGEAAGGPIYAAGIAIYSTALVAYPSFGADLPGSWPRRWRAGLLYGIAGWLGSALGIGMAEGLREVPTQFLAVSGAVIALAVWGARGGRQRALVALYGLPVGIAALVWGAVVLSEGAGRGERSGARGPTADPVARGRAVYIAEGCIHCHSQYVRPETSDEPLWGPFRPFDSRLEVPALLGNRRLGPDLRNVGNRRSPEWQRLHLSEPWGLSPGSRMPSYAHLFRPGERRGEDLVAYLGSLGQGSGLAHYGAALHHVEPPVAAPPSKARGRQLFLQICSICHGNQARGDGPLAEEVPGRAIDLGKKTFWLVSWGPGIGSREDGLARVIRYGVPATSMPGHETMTPRDLADLVAYVGTLPGTGAENGGAVAGQLEEGGG